MNSKPIAIVMLLAVMNITAPLIGQVKNCVAQLVIELADHSGQLPQEAVIRITLKNISGKPLTIARALGEQQGDFNYSIRVFGKNRKPLTMVKNKSDIGAFRPPSAWSNIGVLLNPDETLSETADLSKQYSLHKGESYQVQVDRKIDNPAVTVHSNVVLFTIPR